jgi:VWFA-related protein
MRKFLTRVPQLVAFLLTLLLCLTPRSACPAQATAGKGSRPQDFGAGLKQFRREPRTPKQGAEKSQGTESDAERPDDVIRMNTLLTLLDVTVTDASGTRFIDGLTKDDFLVFEDDHPQQVDTLTPGDDATKMPRSIVLIIDWSGSLLPYLDESIKAAKALVDRLSPLDEVAIVTDDVRLVAGFTRDKKRLKSTLDSLRESAKKGWRGKSLQFSALLATLRDLIDVEKQRPVIIFQTDGDEARHLQDPPHAGSTAPGVYYMSDIYAEVQRSRVKIYTLIPGEKLIGAAPGELLEKGRRLIQDYGGAYEKYNKLYDRRAEKPHIPDAIVRMIAENLAHGQEAAARVAELAGGWTSFFEKPEQAAEDYGRILSDINHQYVISYYPTNKERDGRLRRVRVEVRGHPEFVVRGRQSYYALPQ